MIKQRTMMSILTKKSILVTGGTGSIGTALVKKAILDKAKLIRVFSNDENGLYELESEFSNHKNIEYVIGDIQNEEIVNKIVKDIDIVFHAAALKHVDRCEMNPLETINVNIIGTKNIANAAQKENIQRMIFISTDKAVNPIGVMGATKLLGEKLISSEASHQSNTIFASVRFGNVFHTRGSILPRIEKQISNGGPITLTNPEMKRFFMTKDDAVNLIISSATFAKGGETFVLKMPLIRLEDLFEAMKEILSSKYGYKPSQIKTKIIGTRPGEKLIEYLLTQFEMENVLETKDFFIIPPLNVSVKTYPNTKKPKNAKSYFENMKVLSKNEIIKILKIIYDN
jgi:UDP-N-acetylglucosamine 4,6-dehydratase/5-epimerase